MRSGHKLYRPMELLKSLAQAQSPKSKSKGEALGQSISLNLVYPPPPPPHTHPPPTTNFEDTSEAPRRLVLGIQPKYNTPNRFMKKKNRVT